MLHSGLRPYALMILALFVSSAEAHARKGADRGWVAAWTASAHGGSPMAQPELKFALPSAERGASEQTFRMILRPDVWGSRARIRLSNAFGTRPVTFDDVQIGLQTSGGALVPHSNRPVAFAGKAVIMVQPGQSVVSDAVPLPWVRNRKDPMLANRKLAVSFHLIGDSGPITWHATALTTNYLSAPGSGSPFSTTSWYFIDEVDMAAPGAQTIVAFGDSITDGVRSTLNGDDRWPDVFSRRLHAAFGNRYSVVNEGLSGDMVIGPVDNSGNPFVGGPAATERLDRDVLSLPNIAKVIWLEGINDFGSAGAQPEKVEEGVRDVVKRLRERIPGVKIYMATLTSSLNSTIGSYGAQPVEDKRRTYNHFIRTAGIFDGVIDFDEVTVDHKTGELRAEFQPTAGGQGDKLHPNRAGYAAMGNAISFVTLFGLHNASRSHRLHEHRAGR
jgi:lysophospholipase L1-like esterase